MCLFPLFQNQSPPPSIFCCPLFSENYLNLQFRINKIVNKHTVDYHPSPSELISKIQLHTFLWTPKRFISPESFLNIFLKMYIPLWLRKSFKFIVLRLLANTFVSKKNWICSFLLMPPSKTIPQVFKEISHSSWTAFSEKIFSSAEGGREVCGVEKITKINYQNCLLLFCF